MRWILFLTVAIGAVAPQGLAGFTWTKELRPDETFNLAALPDNERRDIFDQIEATSFDVPESWEQELRVRRISLGRSDGLLIRGTRLLCGGTGNCETWVFRRSSAGWVDMFARHAPLASAVAFDVQGTGRIPRLLISANISAAEERRTVFSFDGKTYEESECFDVKRDGIRETVSKVRCGASTPETEARGLLVPRFR